MKRTFVFMHAQVFLLVRMVLQMSPNEYLDQLQLSPQSGFLLSSNFFYDWRIFLTS